MMINMMLSYVFCFLFLGSMVFLDFDALDIGKNGKLDRWLMPYLIILIIVNR